MKLRVTALIAMIVINIAQYNIWLWAKQFDWYFFYQCETVQYLISGWLFLHPPKPSTPGYLNLIKTYTFLARMWVIFALNDLVDLIFFDPTKFQWNEILFCAAAITYPLIMQKWKEITKHKGSL